MVADEMDQQLSENLDVEMRTVDGSRSSRGMRDRLAFQSQYAGHGHT